MQRRQFQQTALALRREMHLNLATIQAVGYANY